MIFPRRAGIIKKGDSSAAEIAEAQKIDVDISSLPKRADAVTFTTITEVITSNILALCVQVLALTKCLFMELILRR